MDASCGHGFSLSWNLDRTSVAESSVFSGQALLRRRHSASNSQRPVLTRIATEAHLRAWKRQSGHLPKHSCISSVANTHDLKVHVLRSTGQLCEFLLDPLLLSQVDAKMLLAASVNRHLPTLSPGAAGGFHDFQLRRDRQGAAAGPLLGVLAVAHLPSIGLGVLLESIQCHVRQVAHIRHCRQGVCVGSLARTTLRPFWFRWFHLFQLLLLLLLLGMRYLR
mmetsp:Transcript_59253/g.96678  ORF Transcript_59253/g.96678 Transcript_59253/m.96678 type:complete len:221 (-) Transcript_59253:147-809(-)